MEASLTSVRRFTQHFEAAKWHEEVISREAICPAHSLRNRARLVNVNCNPDLFGFLIWFATGVRLL